MVRIGKTMIEEFLNNYTEVINKIKVDGNNPDDFTFDEMVELLYMKW